MAETPIAAIVEALPLPALFVQSDAWIGAINSKAAKILGPGLQGRHFITALRQPAVLEAIETCTQTGETTTAQLFSNDGAIELRFKLRCAPIASAQATGVLITLTDVSDAAQMTQMRRDFVANVSHELRSPLTAVMGFIETLQGPARDDAAARARFLEIMSDETQRMNRLVGDLLSLSQVEAGERVRPQERVDLPALLASVVQMLGPLADQTEAQLRLNLQAGEVHVPADEDQLRQVLSNLIENALKYGGRGVQVTVTLGPVHYAQRLRADAVRIEIADTGPGFDPIHIPRLTERFYRIDSHRSREMGGTGLGLAIVKHILNRHRGHLEVSSELGQGSVFAIIIPI